MSMMSVYIFMGMFSIWLLLRVREITGKSSLPDLGTYLYGKWSIYFINFLIAFAQLGFPIIFFIVFDDVAKGLILEIDSNASSFWTSRVFTQVSLAIVMLYLILKKEIHQLKYAGFALLGMIGVFIVLLFLHFLISNPDPHPTEDLTDTKLDIKFFANIPTMTASYSFQPSLFTSFASLKHKTTGNGLKAGWSAIVVAYVTYSVIPLLGFGLYGANVQSNLLKNLSGDSGFLPIFLQILFLIIAIVHIPIIFFIGKEAALIIFDEATRGSYSKQNAQVEKKVKIEEEGQELPQIQAPQEGENEEAHQPNDEEVPNTSRTLNSNQKVIKAPNPKEYLNMKPVYYYTVTIICYIAVVTLSIVVGDVSVFFGIIGSTAGSWLIIAGPASFYILSVHKHNVPMDTWYLKLSYFLSYVYCGIGLLMMFGLNTCVIINAIRK